MKRSHMLSLTIPALALFVFTATPSAAVLTMASEARSKGPADLTAFPPARNDQTRHVIRLPKQRDEEGFKVEIIVGKTMKIDCNNHAFGGKVEERTAEGWGYTYYVLDSLGTARSTMMGCTSRAERAAFVRSSAQALVRYNSRLPLVVYAPSDAEVRYRIWRAGAERPFR
jgi:ecotin